MAHGDPKHPKKNPHPMQRYEVIATADAPGPWDKVTGYVSFKVTNLDCVPQDSFTGIRNVPNIDFEFEMTKIGPNTWKGYFYRDSLQDQDYFGRGTCHWSADGVGADFIVRDIEFPSADLLQSILKKGARTTYFKRSDYGNLAITHYGPQSYSSADPNVIEHMEEYFQVTISVKEMTP